MATKKEKILENAQKFIAKGQLDRAIKEYEQLVVLEPQDIRCRQRLAELLVRANRKDEAISEYETIGKYYAENAYHLKAIAVYKQIQKLDPANITISLTLASLNEKQGLVGNALAEYDQVCTYYLKAEQPSEALKVIDKMLAVDPENLNTRLKLAETELSVGHSDKAYTDFVKLLLTLQKRDDGSAFNQIADRIRALFPEKGEFLLDLLAVQLEEGSGAAIIDRVQEYIRKDSSSLRAWNLLVDTHTSLGEQDNAKATYLQMTRIFPGDLAVKEGLVRLLLEMGDTEGAIEHLGGFLKEFLAAGAFHSGENMYTTLLGLNPTDLRVLEGLKAVYDAAGQQVKSRVIADKICSLAAVKEKASTAAVVEPPIVSPEDLPAVEIAPSLPVETTPVREEAPTVVEPAPPVPEVTPPLLEEPPTASVEDLAVHPDGGDDWEEELDLTFLNEGEEPVVHAGGVEVEESVPELELPDELELELPDELDLELSEDIDLGAPDLQDLGLTEELEPDPEVEPEHELAEETLLELPDILDLELSDEPELELTDDPELEPEDMPGPETLSADEVSLDFDAEELDSLAEELFPGDLVAPDAPPESALETKQTFPSPGSQIRIEEPLDEEDAETHYNLGIAYKEMGLYDEAVAELRLAARSPQRQFSCLTLEGICYRDKGDITMAESVYRRGIALPGLVVEEKICLIYELAFLYETVGRNEEALQLYREAHDLDPGFRDLAAKIAALEGGNGGQDHDDMDLLELELEESE